MPKKQVQKIIYDNVKSQYRPWFHINTNRGKINNITSIYKKNGWYYILFDHELNFNKSKSVHCLSLVTTNDFYNFQYHYEVIKPDNDFDRDGIASASFINRFKKQYFIYLGVNNILDKTIKSIVVASTNFINFKINNKYKIIDSEEFFSSYQSNIDAMSTFSSWWNQQYLLITGSNNSNNPIIFLFKLNHKLNSIKFVKRIIIKSHVGKIISPSVIFSNQRVYLFYTNLVNKNNTKEYRSYYAILSYHEMFQKDDTLVELFSEIDYSPIFGGIQTYKHFNKIHLLGCLNDGNLFNLKESNNSWANVISSVRNLQLSKFGITTSIDPKIKLAILNNSYPMTAYAKIVITKNNDSILIADEKKKWIEIKIFNNHCTIINRVFKKPIITEIIDCDNISLIEIMVDVSLIEININKSRWYSSRCYFENQVKIIQG